MKNVLRKFSFIFCILCLILLVGCKENKKDPVKLTQPENVVVSTDYILSWNPVTNASGYAIRIGSFVDNVTTPMYDLKSVLVEGPNFIFVEALGDDKYYLDSDASFIQVDYTKYSPERFKEAVEKIYEDNSVDIDEEVVEDTIELLELALKGTKLSKDDALVVLDFFVSFTNAPLFDGSMEALQEFKNIDVKSEDLADYLYNLLYEYLVMEQKNGNNDATMFIYVLSGNKGTVTETLEATYLYATEFGDQYTVAVEKYDKSARTDADGYVFYKDLVEALFNEKRPTEADVLEITSSIKYALGMFESADFGSEELEVITEMINLLETTYDPLVNATYKILSVITVEQFAVIADSVEVLVDFTETGLTWENRHAVELAIKDLINVLGEIELDITEEEAKLKEAWEKFENSSALPYLEQLINDILDSIEGGDEIKKIFDMIFGEGTEEIEYASIIKTVLGLIEVPAELQTVIDEVLAVIEAYEKVPTTEQELVNSILDKLTTDETVLDAIEESGYEELINDVVDVLRTYDGDVVTMEKVTEQVMDTILADEALKAEIKEEVDSTIPEAEVTDIQETLQTAVESLDSVLSDEVVTVEEMLSVIENVSDINFSGIIPEDTDLSSEIPTNQINILYDLLVYYQGILAE